TLSCLRAIGSALGKTGPCFITSPRSDRCPLAIEQTARCFARFAFFGWRHRETRGRTRCKSCSKRSPPRSRHQAKSPARGIFAFDLGAARLAGGGICIRDNVRYRLVLEFIRVDAGSRSSFPRCVRPNCPLSQATCFAL